MKTSANCAVNYLKKPVFGRYSQVKHKIRIAIYHFVYVSFIHSRNVYTIRGKE